jgi:hypothetical protein
MGHCVIKLAVLNLKTGLPVHEKSGLSYAMSVLRGTRYARYRFATGE